MSTTISSKRYAQAVFQIAESAKQLDEWLMDLRKVATIMTNKDFKAIIENPKLTFEEKSKLARENLTNTHPLVLNLCYLLIAKNKTSLTNEIATEYGKLLDNFKGIKRAQIVTSIPLDKSDETMFIKRLEEVIKSKLIVIFSVDPSIIGGFIARIDDRLIDGSIRNKLEQLRRNISGVNN